MIAYYLADTPEERARAENEVVQTLLLWEAANGPQGGSAPPDLDSSSTGLSDSDLRQLEWETESKIRDLERDAEWELRDLEREIGRLEDCINYGVSCY